MWMHCYLSKLSHLYFYVLVFDNCEQKCIPKLHPVLLVSSVTKKNFYNLLRGSWHSKMMAVHRSWSDFVWGMSRHYYRYLNFINISKNPTSTLALSGDFNVGILWSAISLRDHAALSALARGPAPLHDHLLYYSTQFIKILTPEFIGLLFYKQLAKR